MILKIPDVTFVKNHPIPRFIYTYLSFGLGARAALFLLQLVRVGTFLVGVSIGVAFGAASSAFGAGLLSSLLAFSSAGLMNRVWRETNGIQAKRGSERVERAESMIIETLKLLRNSFNPAWPSFRSFQGLWFIAIYPLYHYN